jgi:hypothetical protein
MLSGFILVGFLAALVTFGFTKLRRRVGMSVSNRTWGITFVVTVLIILAIWASGHH